jgi:hypothetical protein
VPTAHDDLDPMRLPIRDEARRLEESAMYSPQSQFERAKFWRGLNLSLGVGAAILAAVAGVVGLASDKTRILSGVLALVVAGIVSVLTTVNADRRHSQAAAAANAYLEIQTGASFHRSGDAGPGHLTGSRSTPPTTRWAACECVSPAN